MKIINKDQVYSLTTPAEIINEIENSFTMIEDEGVEIPQRVHLNKDGNILLLMPCFTPDRYAVKLVSVFPGNNEKGLPALFGTVILNDGKTGQPLAIIDGAALTAVRTGAVGAVGARYTVPGEIESLGIIGAGVQGYHQAWYIGIEKGIKKINVFDLNREVAEKMIQDLSKVSPGVSIQNAGDVRELVGQSDLIVTATTSEQPVIPDDLRLVLNKHFIGIGSYKPGMRELPHTLYRELDQVFIDTDHALEEAGDLIQPLNKGCFKIDQVIPLKKVIRGEVKVSGKKPTFFKTAGMALFDLVVADLLYRKTI